MLAHTLPYRVLLGVSPLIQIDRRASGAKGDMFRLALPLSGNEISTRFPCTDSHWTQELPDCEDAYSAWWQWLRNRRASWPMLPNFWSSFAFGSFPTRSGTHAVQNTQTHPPHLSQSSKTDIRNAGCSRQRCTSNDEESVLMAFKMRHELW
jgi:hypothetical protein